jgi:hypothetical protein
MRYTHKISINLINLHNLIKFLYSSSFFNKINQNHFTFHVMNKIINSFLHVFFKLVIQDLWDSNFIFLLVWLFLQLKAGRGVKKFWWNQDLLYRILDRDRLLFSYLNTYPFIYLIFFIGWWNLLFLGIIFRLGREPTRIGLCFVIWIILLILEFICLAARGL